jgi:hypothetical protein
MPRAKKPYRPNSASPIIKPKLTHPEVREIRKVFRMAKDYAKRQGQKGTRLRPGLRQELADRYGISIWTIDHIRKGERWSTLR